MAGIQKERERERARERELSLSDIKTYSKTTTLKQCNIGAQLENIKKKQNKKSRNTLKYIQKFSK